MQINTSSSLHKCCGFHRIGIVVCLRAISKFFGWGGMTGTQIK